MSNTVQIQKSVCFCPTLIQKLFSSSGQEQKTSSASARAFQQAPEPAPKNPISYTLAAAIRGVEKTLSVAYKILTINGLITPTRVMKSLFITVKTVCAIVWPIFDLGLSFIPGYSQTKALIKAIPSLVILTTSAFIGYQAWQLIATTALGKTMADAAASAYNSPFGEMLRNTAASVGCAAIDALKEAGKYALSAGREYVPTVLTWIYSPQPRQ